MRKLCNTSILQRHINVFSDKKNSINYDDKTSNQSSDKTEGVIPGTPENITASSRFRKAYSSQVLQRQNKVFNDGKKAIHCNIESPDQSDKSDSVIPGTPECITASSRFRKTYNSQMLQRQNKVVNDGKKSIITNNKTPNRNDKSQNVVQVPPENMTALSRLRTAYNSQISQPQSDTSKVIVKQFY